MDLAAAVADKMIVIGARGQEEGGGRGQYAYNRGKRGRSRGRGR